MSTVEQIHHLETRVDRLLATLRELRSDNDSLRGDLAATEERASELERRLTASESARQEAQQRGDDLEQRLTSLHTEHEEIEATITRTLDQLGKLGIGPPGDTADDADPVEASADVDDDAPADETALLRDEEPPVDDAPEAGAGSAADADSEADADNREGDDLDIF